MANEKCAYCDGRLGLDWIKTEKDGVIHYSKIECAELLKGQRDRLARQVADLLTKICPKCNRGMEYKNQDFRTHGYYCIGAPCQGWLKCDKECCTKPQKEALHGS